MDQVTHQIYEHQQTDTSKLNWDEAPPAPAHRCVLEWDGKRWDKSYGGLVWAHDVKDELFIRYGAFGTFRTPVLLDEEGFRKLCYLVVGEDDLEDDVTDDFREYANGKYDRRSFVTVCARSEDEHEGLLETDLFIDEDGHLVKSGDQVRFVNCSETELNDAVCTVSFQERLGRPSTVGIYVPAKYGGPAMRIFSIQNLRKFFPGGADNYSLLPPKSLKHVVDWSKMPPERKRLVDQEAGKKAVGLCDLSKDVGQLIASYLPLLDVERNLRRACRDTFWNFQKPPPENLEYDFVYFSVSFVIGNTDKETEEDIKKYQEEWYGVAHTTSDVLIAIMETDWGMDNVLLTLKFVKLDRNHSIVPIFKLKCEKIRSERIAPADFDPLGSYYCGVQQASHVELDSSPILLDGRVDPEQTVDAGAVLRHCRDWIPREPRIQLRHIGVRKIECRHCGHGDDNCRCNERFIHPGGKTGREHRMYYSPEWFKDRDELDDFAFCAPSDSLDKNVILFWKPFEWLS